VFIHIPFTPPSGYDFVYTRFSVCVVSPKKNRSAGCGITHVSVCLFVCLFVCLSVCLSVQALLILYLMEKVSRDNLKNIPFRILDAFSIPSMKLEIKNVSIFQ
jgi:hypothetical protein